MLTQVSPYEVWMEDARSPAGKWSPRCRSTQQRRATSSHWNRPPWSQGVGLMPIWNPIWLNQCPSWSLPVGLAPDERCFRLLTQDPSRWLLLPNCRPTFPQLSCIGHCIIVWIVSVLLLRFYLVNGLHYESNLFMCYLMIIGKFHFRMKLSFYIFYSWCLWMNGVFERGHEERVR